MTCPLEHAIGPYALGTLDANERADVAAHLEQCPVCRAEAESLMGLAGLLSRVPVSEVTDGPPAPDEALFGRLLTAALGEVAERRRRRRRVLVAVGVAAALALGGTGTALVLRREPTPVAVTAASGQVHATVTLLPWRGGTGLHLSIWGVGQRERCRMVAVAADGSHEVAASWEADYLHPVQIQGSTSIERPSLRWIYVETANHRRLVSLSVPG